jgi:gas vesicle protein
MADYDDVPYIVIERRSSGGLGPFFWGLLLGAGAALLYAPRSGEETQEEIRERARRIRAAAEDRVVGARDTVVDVVSRTRDRIQDQIDTVRDTIETRTDQAREVVDAGRRAARDARSDLERRVSDAKDAYADDDHPDFGDDIAVIRTAEVDVIVTDVIVEEAERRPDLG